MTNLLSKFCTTIPQRVECIIKTNSKVKIMGILLAGLVGQSRQKAGNFVFSNWKGINTFRAYAKPANPNTPDQQAQRTKFKNVIKLASSLLPTLIVTFWNPFASMMSGFNAFVKSVFENVSSTGFVTAACLVTKGTLETLHSLTATYTSVSGVLSLAWIDTIYGNGLNTDSVNILVINIVDNKVLYYENNFSSRVEANQVVTIPSGLTATNLAVFVWASRGAGSAFVVSNSSGVIAS